MRVSWHVCTVLMFILPVFFCGCSDGESSVISGMDESIDGMYSVLPVGVTEWASEGIPAAGAGALGMFNVFINPINKTAELVSLRGSALVDVLEVVDITNFLSMAPCTECVKIKSVSIDIDGYPVVSIGIMHPFDVGDPLKPISGRNRADLHVFNVEGIVVSNAPVEFFTGVNQSVADFKLINADGYTGYLDDQLDEFFETEATIHPYITFFDDYSIGNFDADNPMGFESVTDPPPSGNLIMAMGCDYNYQDYLFDINEPFEFLFVVGCTYAVSSASKSLRFSPEYRVPQHIKKAASEVYIEIITNDLEAGVITSSAEIEIHVVDMNHGVAVGTLLDEMFADSSVNDIFVDIPQVTASPCVIDGNNSVSGTGHDPSDPLIYQATIENSSGADVGLYAGIVKVSDYYPPGLNVSPLLNQMDGIERVGPIENPLIGLFAIDEFATYQVFTISVSESCIPPVVTSIDPDVMTITPGIYDDVTISGQYFEGSGGVTQVYLDDSTSQIHGDDIIVNSDTELTCDFDVSSADVGTYDVVVVTACEGRGIGLLEIAEMPAEWVGTGYNHTNISQNPSAQSIDPLDLTQVWTNTTSGSPNGFKTSGASIADGKVYFVSEPSGYYYATTEFSVYCLDLTDGHEIWSNFINLQDDYGRAMTSPVWYEDKVYVAGDNVYCFDDEDGTEIWRYDGAPANNYDFISNSPKVYDGQVYCSSRSSVFVCLDADNGTELWTYPYEFGECFPATDGERVYFPGFSNLFCCNCTTGNLEWSQPLPDHAGAWSAPVVLGDRVYQNGFYGSLYCFDKYDGTPIWTFDITQSAIINSMPVPFIDTTDDKPVFVFGSATGGNPLWAVKDDGSTYSNFWTRTYSSGDYYDGSAAILGDYVIIGDRYNQQFLVIDKITGDLECSYPLPDRITAQPAIAFDRIVVLSDNSVECYM